MKSALAVMPPAGPRVQLFMESEPAYELAQLIPAAIDEKILPLWLNALDRPDRDLQRQVGDSIVRAKQLGMKGLNPKVAERLRKAFQSADHPVVRRSLARALVALDDRSAADPLWEASQQDYQLALIVQPVLGTWKHAPAVESALSRINDEETSASLKHLAIQMIGNAGEKKARDTLVALVDDDSARIDLRLVAADSLAKIFSEGLEELSQELSVRKRSEDPLSGVLAARLLDQHSGPETVRLLEQYAQDSNTAVQGAALKRLGEIDHKLVVKFATASDTASQFSVKHPDANVRKILIESLYSVSDLSTIPTLRTFLDDPHPVNRTAAGDALYDLAQKNDQFRDAVTRELSLALADSSWRTLERAALIAAGLDFEESSNQLIPLLNHDRPEVAVASAYALKVIAVTETLPAVLDRLKHHLNTKLDRNTERTKVEIAISQSPHLCEQLGKMKYQPADSELRRLIPQTDNSRELHDHHVRASAIWALGLLYQDKQNEMLIEEFIGRVKALGDPFNPDAAVVGEASAYALGWMKAKSAIDILQEYAARGPQRSYSDACAWALERITGKQLPLPAPITKPAPIWFLRPTPQ